VESRRRGTTLLVLLVGWLAILLGVAGSASAHAGLISTDPPSGANLATAPNHVSFTFSEHVSLVRDGIRLVDGKGTSTTLDGATVAGATVRAPLPKIGDGAYIVVYRVISADTHPVSGSVAFSVGPMTPGMAMPAPYEVPKPSTGVRATSAIERWVSYAGAVGVIGVPAFVLLCWPAGRTSRRLRHVPSAAAALVVLAALIAIPVQAVRATGRSFGASLHDGPISDVLHSAYGHAAQQRMLCAVLAAGLWAWWRVQPRRQLALAWGIAAIALALGYAKAGHPAVAKWPALTLADDTAHLTAVAIWLGGLAVLAGCVLPTPPEGSASVLARWSNLAMTAVLVLVATGVIQAWRELRSVHALFHHSYGQWVLVKVGLLLLMLLLGNLGRLRVQRYVSVQRYDRGTGMPTAGGGTAVLTAPSPPDLVSRMRQGVLAEVAIGAAVLVATAALVVTNPSPTMADPAQMQGMEGMQAMPGMPTHPAVVNTATDLPTGVHVEVRVANPMAGTPTIELTITKNGKVIRVAELGVKAGLPSAGVEPIPLTVKKLAVGSYRVAEAPLSIPGRWVLTITVRTSSIDAGVGAVTVQLY
jgi:copper transport protein